MEKGQIWSIEDENGRIVPIGDKSSIGSSEINISGSPCGAVI